MNSFTLKNGVLHAESVALPALAAQFGTPAYVYSRAALEASLREFQDVLGTHPAGAGALICFAVKANANLAILNIFSRLGAGFDFVSGRQLPPRARGAPRRGGRPRQGGGRPVGRRRGGSGGRGPPFGRSRVRPADAPAPTVSAPVLPGAWTGVPSAQRGQVAGPGS